jgi:hypothetical protein
VSRRFKPNAPASPMPMPRPASIIPCFITIRRTSTPCAPRAIRIQSPGSAAVPSTTTCHRSRSLPRAARSQRTRSGASC